MPRRKLSAKLAETCGVPPDSQAISGRLGDTSARTASGNAAPPARAKMNSRRFIQSPRRRGRAAWEGLRGRAPWRFEASRSVAADSTLLAYSAELPESTLAVISLRAFSKAGVYRGACQGRPSPFA